MGYRGATLEDIAGALNVTQPALYYYARSKEELLAECGQFALTIIRKAFEEAEHEPSGLAQLTAFYRRWAEIICDDFGRCFALTDVRDLSEERAEGWHREQKTLNRAVEAMILRGMADGSIAEHDPGNLRRILFSAFNSVPRWYRPSGGATPVQIADELLTVFIEGLKPRRD